MNSYNLGRQRAEQCMKELAFQRWLALGVAVVSLVAIIVPFATESPAIAQIGPLLLMVGLLGVAVVVLLLRRMTWQVVLSSDNAHVLKDTAKSAMTFTVEAQVFRGFNAWWYKGVKSVHPPEWSDCPMVRVDGGILEFPEEMLIRDAVKGFFDTLPLPVRADAEAQGEPQT